jgi:ribosome recycling factor
MYVDLNKAEAEMAGVIRNLEAKLGGIRTGRASTALLEPVHVEVYGTRSRLDAVASLSVLGPRLLGVTVWDRAAVKPVEKAIREAGLGVEPMVDGTTIRLPLPALDEGRRKELARLAGRHAEEARVGIRTVRRTYNDAIRRSKDLATPVSGSLQKKVQALTDRFVEVIDRMARDKEAEILDG